MDHSFSDWIGGSADTHVGSIHKIEERFTGLPAEKLLIQFRDNAEFFAPEAYAAVRAGGRGGQSIDTFTRFSTSA